MFRCRTIAELRARLAKIVPRVLLAERGREFRRKGLAEIMAQGYTCANLAGRLRVVVHFTAPTKHRRDIDNYIKGAFDCMTHARVWIDDDQIDDLRVIRHAPQRGGNLAIVVTQLED